MSTFLLLFILVKTIHPISPLMLPKEILSELLFAVFVTAMPFIAGKH
jgi:hypothetical protein